MKTTSHVLLPCPPVCPQCQCCCCCCCRDMPAPMRPVAGSQGGGDPSPRAMQQRTADSGSIIITQYTQVEGGCLGLGFQASPFRRDNQFHPEHGHHKSLPGYPSHISFACYSPIGRVTQQAAGPNTIELSPRCTEYTGSKKRKIHPHGCVMIPSSKYEWLIGDPGRGAEQTDFPHLHAWTSLTSPM